MSLVSYARDLAVADTALVKESLEALSGLGVSDGQRAYARSY